MRTKVHRLAAKQAQYIYIAVDDFTVDIVNDDTGEVVYSTPTTRRALERAVAFAGRRYYTIRRVEIADREEGPPAVNELSRL